MSSEFEDEDLPGAVDDYLDDVLMPRDPVLDAAIEASDAAGLPPIAVTATQGRLLAMLARLANARRILALGTLGGYSTIWLARTLPAEGALVSLEVNAAHADVARANVQRAGLSHVVDIRVGTALDSLDALVREKAAPFDFIFIDADKANIPSYFTRALELSRSGTVMVVDNVIREGAVIDAERSDPSVQGVRRFFDLVRDTPKVTATAVQTVGAKGYDGFALVMVE